MVGDVRGIRWYCASEYSSSGAQGGEAFWRRGGVWVFLDGLGELDWDDAGICNVVTGILGVGEGQE